MSPRHVSTARVITYPEHSSVFVITDGRDNFVIKVWIQLNEVKSVKHLYLTHSIMNSKQDTLLAKYYVVVFLLDVDDCLNNPCQNGGTCVDKADSHTCLCVAGWTGQNCTIGYKITNIANSQCVSLVSCILFAGINSNLCEFRFIYYPKVVINGSDQFN